MHGHLLGDGGALLRRIVRPTHGKGIPEARAHTCCLLCLGGARERRRGEHGRQKERSHDGTKDQSGTFHVSPVKKKGRDVAAGDLYTFGEIVSKLVRPASFDEAQDAPSPPRGRTSFAHAHGSPAVAASEASDWRRMVRPAGLEPATTGLEGQSPNVQPTRGQSIASGAMPRRHARLAPGSSDADDDAGCSGIPTRLSGV